MSFLKKMFGFGKVKVPTEVEEAIAEILGGIIDISGLELDVDLTEFTDDTLYIELSGKDEELLCEKDGQLLDGLQFYIKRAVQHRLPDSRIEIQIDTNGFRESADQELREQADEMIKEVLEKNKPVYFRALPPKHRKVVHQHLSGDERIKSRSVGDGLYKKIKIYPASMERRPRGERGNQAHHKN